MPDAYFLSEYDKQLLEMLLEEQRQKVARRQGRPHRPRRGSAPEVLICKTPASGIPALRLGPGSYGTSTGTNMDDPGSAVCTVWHIDTPYAGTATDQLHTVLDFTKVVYNLSTADVAGNAWILAVKDKFGMWVAATGDTCSKTEKVVTSLCWHGTILKQLFKIKRGCDTISTGCEEVPVCTLGACANAATTGTSTTSGGAPDPSICPPSSSGGGTAGGGGGFAVCQCPIGWNFLAFTVTGVVDNNCTNCDLINGLWCLSQREPPACGWNGNHTGTGPCGTVVVFASVDVYEDGSASLTFTAVINNKLITLASYYCQHFQTGQQDLTGVHCRPYANSFRLMTSTCDCVSWPSSLTLTPTVNDNCAGTLGGTSSSGGSVGGGCHSCGTHSTAQATLSTVGWVDGACTVCTDMANGGAAITLTETSSGSCVWTLLAGPAVTCGGTPTVVNYELTDNGVTGWDFYITTGTGVIVAQYFLAYASWNCSGANTMNLVALGTGCTTVPITVSVTLT